MVKDFAQGPSSGNLVTFWSLAYNLIHQVITVQLLTVLASKYFTVQTYNTAIVQEPRQQQEPSISVLLDY